MKSKSSPSNRKKAAAAKKAEEDERMVRYLTGPHGPAASTLHTALKLVVPNNPEILPDIKLLRGGLEKNGHQVIQGNLSGVETTMASPSATGSHGPNPPAPKATTESRSAAGTLTGEAPVP